MPSDPFFSRSILWALKQLCIKFKQSAARMLHVGQIIIRTHWKLARECLMTMVTNSLCFVYGGRFGIVQRITQRHSSVNSIEQLENTSMYRNIICLERS